MDNERKKHVNIESLSSGDIFALLNSIESDDEGFIEFCLPKTRMKPLGQDETNSAPDTQRTSNQSPSPATQRTSNQSPSPANQRTANQSPAAATQRTADQSSAAVLTRRTSDQSSKSIPPPTITLPQNTKKRKQSSMIKDKTKKKKVNAPSDKNNTNQKKGSVLQDEDKTKKTKANTTKEWKWEDKEKPMTKKECTLEAEVLVDLDHGSTPFDIFQTVTGMNELLEIIVMKTNRCATQKGRNFETTEDEMKAFLGINFIMGINKLPSLEDYWSN